MIKKLLFPLVFGFGISIANAQVINQSFNQATENGDYPETSIQVSGNVISIKTKVVYNALPDGYHVTYTYTNIASSLDQLESITHNKINALRKDAKKLKIKEEDVLVDVIALDPIFNMFSDSSGSQSPTGYKTTQNVTFNIHDINIVQELNQICLQHSIYDIIDITPYLINVKSIHDSLAAKSVEVLNFKKQLGRDIGFTMSDGKPSFSKQQNVIYPSERYLKSYINNSTLFKHHISQNSSTHYNRRVDVDTYYTLDLRDADFVFNSKETKPVIQFYYEINYQFVKRDREAEARQVEMEKERLEKQKNIFILDKDGKLKEITF